MELEIDETLLDEQEETDEKFEGEVIDIGGKWSESRDVSDSSTKTLPSSDTWTRQNGKVALCVTRLLNNVSQIFREQFSDNPSHTAKADGKIRRKIMEKEEAHGIKQG